LREEGCAHTRVAGRQQKTSMANVKMVVHFMRGFASGGLVNMYALYNAPKHTGKLKQKLWLFVSSWGQAIGDIAVKSH